MEYQDTVKKIGFSPLILIAEGSQHKTNINLGYLLGGRARAGRAQCGRGGFHPTVCEGWVHPILCLWAGSIHSNSRLGGFESTNKCTALCSWVGHLMVGVAYIHPFISAVLPSGVRTVNLTE